MKNKSYYVNKIRQMYLSFKHIVNRSANINNLEIIDLSYGAKQINDIIFSTDKDYIGFTDENAEYSENYFRNVLKGFGINNNISAVRGRIIAHNGNMIKVSKTSGKVYSIYNTDEDYTSLFMIPNGVVYKTRVLRENNICFDEKLHYCRNAAFAVKYQEKAGLSLQMNNEKYKTGEILDETSQDTPQSNIEKWYTESALPLLNALKNEDGSLSKNAQFAILFLTIQRFNSNQNAKVKMAFSDPCYVDEYLKDVGIVMNNISDEVLFCKSPSLKWSEYKKLYLAQLRDPESELQFDIEFCSNDAALFLKDSDTANEICMLSSIYFNVVNFHFLSEGGVRGVEMIIKNPRCFPLDSYKIILNNSAYNDKQFEAKHISALAGLVTFFDRDAARQDAFRCFVPIDGNAPQQTISLNVVLGDHVVQKRIAFSNNWQNKINSSVSSSYWYKEGFVFSLSEDKLNIVKAKADEIPKYEEKYISDLKLLYDSEKNKAKKNILKKVISWREAYWNTKNSYDNRRIWVYYDKGYKAGDNAEYAFRYAHQQNDGIEKYFYIDPNCSDWKRLESYGYDLMDPSSPEGVLNAMHAEVIYMTHIPPYTKLGIPEAALKYVKDLLDAKVIRLYHGFPITRSSSYAQISNDAAAVAIGSSYEKQLYMNEDNCFEESQIIESGMPRYDDLISDSKKQILFAPTWRPSLTGKAVSSGAPLYNPEFKNSVYYKMYDEVLKNPKLIRTAKEKGYKLIMFMHPTLSAQTCDFEKSEVVDSLSCTDDIDYVSIMKQSDLMVTDFSSVQYDFAYMRKPVVYFHAPELPYWRITNFDYESIGFGEICKNTEELADVLCDYMNNDCSLKPVYQQRIEQFFIHNDDQAAKRLYESTLSLFVQ